MTVIATLVTELLADDSGFQAGLDSSLASARGWSASLGTIATAGTALIAAGGVAAVAAVGAVGVAALSAAGQVDQAQNMIQAGLGVTAEEAETLGAVALEVFRNNFGESIAEAGEAVTEVARQLGDLGVTSEQEIGQAAESAFLLRDAFGVDVNESLRGARVLMSEFGLSSTEAFDLITGGFQEIPEFAQDGLDTIGEYSNLFADAGFDAAEMFSIIESGAAGGVLGTDKVADAVKEMVIRFNEGADGVGEAFDAIGLDFDEIQQQVADGDANWADYFDAIVGGLNDIEDPIERSQAQVGIFGTMAEDLGSSFTEGLDPALRGLEDMAGRTEDLNVMYDNWPAMWETIKRNAQAALVPLGDKLLEIAQEAMPLVESGLAWLETELPRIIDVAVAAVGELYDWFAGNILPVLQEVGAWLFGEGIPAFLAFVGPIVAAVIPGLQQLGQWIMQIAAAVLPLLGAAIQFVIDHWNVLGPVIGIIIGLILAIQAPVLLVIAAVVALATAWANNWGDIQGKVQAARDFIQGIVGPMLDRLRSWWEEHGDSVMTIVETFVTIVRNTIEEKVQQARDAVEGILGGLQAFWETHGEAITEAAQLAWDSIKEAIDTALELIGTAVDTFAGLLETDWRQFLENLRSTAQEKWDAVLAAIEGVIGDITGAVEGLIADIAAFFLDRDWGELGSAIVDGILAGLQAGAGAVLEFIRGLAGDLLGTITAALGISSPSRAFMVVGEQIAAGLALGMARATPAVEDALLGMMPAAAFKGVGGGLTSTGSVSGGDTIQHFHLNVTSEQSVGRLVDDFYMLEAAAG